MAWAGMAMQGAGSLMQGDAARATGKNAKAQLYQQANEVQASSQIDAQNDERTNRYVQSRALALAAASGGGATDPSVVNNISQIAGEGEFRALTTRYGGDVRATSLRNAGNAAKANGTAGATGDYLAGIGTLAKGGTSLYSKYGSNPTYGGSTDFYTDDTSLAH